LRQFSSDQLKRRISLFYLPTSKVIRGVSIKDQAYKINIYGSDQILEKHLWETETKASKIIDRIITSEVMSLSAEEEFWLKHFINLQINRTPGKINELQKYIDKETKIIFRDDPRVKDFINDFTIQIRSPYHFMFVIASKLLPTLFDLKISLLKNSTGRPLLIGQHPGVITNPFLDEKKWMGSRQGIGSKGAVIFLPISPNHAIALYDRKRYALKDFASLGTLSESDVEKINLLQFCYTTDCIYFHGDGKGIDFFRHDNATRKFRNREKTELKVFQNVKEEYKNGIRTEAKFVEQAPSRKHRRTRSELIVSSTKEPPIIPKFDFLSTKVGAIFEELGPSMDISREWVRDFMDKTELFREPKDSI
jgi:hypothetical protein